MNPIVHKFGGVALANADAIRHAVDIVANGQRAGTAVVASAMGGVTDALLDVASRAKRRDRVGSKSAIESLRQRHLAAADELTTDSKQSKALRTSIDHELDDLARLAHSVVAAPKRLTPALTDRIIARGERLAARLFTATLRAKGLEAEYVEATRVIHASGPHGNATPDFERTARAVRDEIVPLIERGVIPVVPGFTARGPKGVLVTLGRGGSDLTATLLGRSLGSSTVTLWKDVPGVLTADPRVVPDARLIRRVHVREAAELAYYGAKVLHPRALLGLSEQTRLFIRPLADPSAAGTEISTRRDRAAEKRHPVRAVTTIGEQALVTISGDGMVGVPGIAARAFAALQKVGISVALISQASSEHSICLAVPGGVAGEAEAALRDAFAQQLEAREVEGIDVRPNTAILAIVGLGMAGTIGVASRLFEAIARAKTSVIAIAQGASELNISVVVDEKRAARVQRAVHDAFHLSKIGGGAASISTRADVVILGFGRIGRELASQLCTAKEAQGPHGARVVTVIDSTGYVFNPRGIPRRRLAELSREKEAGGSLAEVRGGIRANARQALDDVAQHALSRPILVDVTAGDTGDILETALHAGMDIVLANKRPLASASGTTRGLSRTAAARGRRLLHEATVGAGLPIIDTIKKLQESGDEILRIEGCPSGTLGYLFGELGRGTSFSSALRAAMQLGYTEPDPREDLSGMDVARKALILGRLLGFEGELETVEVESLVPLEWRESGVQDFIARLEEMDPAWRARVERARVSETVLRYRATVSPASVHVGLVGVALGSSFAALTGTDNQFAITTARYRTNPIVITGPGAGVGVTAAGVLNDVLKLAGSR
ncbi:MAG TPA: aspartate kinase [Gemmatimonadaceae bacterium]|nr:aspartate kinase [Gemmatimonadaceae bacterium]